MHVHPSPVYHWRCAALSGGICRRVRLSCVRHTHVCTSLSFHPRFNTSSSNAHQQHAAECKSNSTQLRSSTSVGERQRGHLQLKESAQALWLDLNALKTVLIFRFDCLIPCFASLAVMSTTSVTRWICPRWLRVGPHRVFSPSNHVANSSDRRMHATLHPPSQPSMRRNSLISEVSYKTAPS